MTDPWTIQKSSTYAINTEHDSANERTAAEQEEQSAAAETSLEFEDNFAPPQLDNVQATVHNVGSNCNVHQPLPDSANYLRGLERKLQKIKKGSKLVEALEEKRQDTLRTLLQGDDRADSATAQDCDAQLELDTPLNNGNTSAAVQEIYRHLQPVQAVTVGELVHIVKHDQLEQQRHHHQEAEAEPGIAAEETNSAEHS